MTEKTEFDSDGPAGNGSGQKSVDLGIDGLSAAVHLGAGGSANVFAARVMDTGEQVAVKLLRASADSEKERTRFEREQDTLRTLASQDGIVPVLDAGLTDREEPYFLMPLMEGSLQDRIDSEGALDWQTATQLIAEVADTVEYAHTQKILHRDIKPGNILLDEEGVPRVADFGIAKLLDSSHSKSSKSLGTPSFMPPERFNGEEATAASDVYGLAATLSALITGSAPFLTGENDTDVAVMMRVVTEDPPALDGPDVPEAVRGAVHAAMSKAPEERPQTAGEFASILRLAIDPHLDPALAGPVTVAIPRRNLTIPDGPATTGSSQRAATIELDNDDESSKKRAWLLPVAAAALFIALLGSGAALALGGDDGPGELESAEVADEEVTPEVEGTGEANVEGAPLDGEDATDDSNGGADGSNSDDNSDGAPGEGNGDSSDDDDDDDDNAGEGSANSLGEGDGDTGDGGGTGGEGNGGAIDPDPNPTACISPSTTAVKTGQTVRLSNCSSDATSYSWDLDGLSSTSTSPSASWTTTGAKTVRLTARGPGGSDVDSVTITVTEDPPPTPAATACFNPNYTSVEVGQSVSFSNCSSDASSYSWTFGDGGTSSQSSPTKAWSTAGSKTVRLTATGPGGSDVETRTIAVTAKVEDPVACFTMSSSTITEGHTVTFSNCSSHATSYSWTFGDGGTSTQANPSRTFAHDGSYTIRLTANGPGGSHWTSRTLTVNPEIVTGDERVRPSKIGCNTLGPAEWSWAWETLPSWVNDYKVQYDDGATVSVGKQPPVHQTTRRVTKIIAVDKNNIELATSVSVAAYCAEIPPGGPAVPSGVRCVFSNFRYEGTRWTWSESWSWNNDPSVSYSVRVENNGNLGGAVSIGGNSYGTDPVN
ncbi:MAG: protein kinase domain-containing protein, partial [Acidimicrobiales bacterium]